MSFVYLMVSVLLMFGSYNMVTMVAESNDEKEKEEETWYGNWNWNIDPRYSDVDSCPYSPPSGGDYSDGAGPEGGGNGAEGGGYGGGPDSQLNTDAGYDSDPD